MYIEYLPGCEVFPGGSEECEVFPGGSEDKASACNTGDPGLIPGLGRSPGEGNGNPLQYSCLKTHGQRSLIGYSSWGPKRVGHDIATEQQLLA